MSDPIFKPAWWLLNPHLQTLWPVILRKSVKNLNIQRERFELSDGDFVDLDWLGQEESGPLIIMLHGLEGSIDSHYARGMMQALRQQHWRVVFMHFRGCSGEANRLPRAYHSGDTDDLADVVKSIRLREPNTLLAAVGYSLGGNVLLKWLGETAYQNPLKAAIAISVPFELEKTAQRFQQGFSRLYQWYLLKCLRERLTNKFSGNEYDVNKIDFYKLQTIREFDDKFTAPLHGFSGADEYYVSSSSRQYLRHIQIPTLILHAKDDPFMTADAIPRQFELSPHVKLELTERGGHVGFVEGPYPWKPKYWLEKRVPKFLANFLIAS